ncbi:MAG: glycosyltransferase [Candidatus Eisenbacteria bacterium]|uniref:Glycosyltransferase n=1 Tax=Eiseniibacteriota bacterium TaxID=2212470 RepID=A0A933W8E0_UNCEI|nr:glycosyltransferase [Candidatus Eisenbacteria bacterium]
MRIAHLDTGREWRGGQGQVLLLMRELARRAHEQLLLAPQGPLLERATAAGLRVARWDSRGELDLPAMARAARLLRAFAPDVAHLHSAHAHALGTLAARSAGARAIVVSRRVDFRVRTNPVSALKYALPVDRYFCISRGVMQAMLDSGVPAGRLALVPSGIDFDAVRAEAAQPVDDLRERLGLPADAEIVGTVASLAPHKNHALLLESVPAVLAARPRAHFVWLGEGECRPALEKRRAELGLEDRVHMPGFDPRARASMTQFDLFVLSSYLEGLCTSLLDAQALGVPIVATAVGGVPEVVSDGRTGALVAALEPAPLAARIVEALAGPETRAEWVAAARVHVQGFGVSHTADRSLEEYERVLAEKPA